jgi:hypothetical protein
MHEATAVRRTLRTVPELLGTAIFVAAIWSTVICAGAAMVVWATNRETERVQWSEVRAPLRYDDDYLEEYAKHVLGKSCEVAHGCQSLRGR